MYLIANSNTFCPIFRHSLITCFKNDKKVIKYTNSAKSKHLYRCKNLDTKNFIRKEIRKDKFLNFFDT